MDSQLLRGFSIGDYLVEPLTGTVTGKGGSTRHLPPKAVEILLSLASNPNSLVSREDLLRKVWGDGGGSQTALNHAMSELRHAFDDRADNPHYIQTVPKLGFRLIAEPRPNGIRESTADYHAPGPIDPPVQARDSDAVSPVLGEIMRRGVVQTGVAYFIVGWLVLQIADATLINLYLPPWLLPFVTFVIVGGFPIVLILSWFLEIAEGRLQWDKGAQSARLFGAVGRNYVAVAGALLMSTLAATAYHVIVGFEPPDTRITQITKDVVIPVEPNSIAVLQFLNINGSERARIFSDGLGEDLLDRLARIPQLLVASRGDSWSLPLNAGSQEVRRRLRVALYVEGSVRLDQDNLQVTVQMINSETGFHVVSRTFEKTLQDFSAVQSEITDLIIANLRIALPDETQMVLTGSHEMPDLDAYALYRRGKESLEEPLTTESLAETIALFEQALVVDPDYAAAHAGLCMTYANGYSVSDDPAYIDQAESTCSAALASNANLDMVYTALGNLYRETGRDTEAETAYLRSLESNEHDVQAIRGLARVYSSQQRLDEAENKYQEAISLQPGNWKSLSSLGGFYYSNGRFLEAAEQFQRVVYLDGSNWQGLTNLGTSLMLAGNFEKALPAFLNAIEINPQRTAYSNVGILYYFLGDFKESVATHRKAVELSPDYNTGWLNLADALMFSSEAEQAEPAFRRAAELTEEQLIVNPRNAEALFELAWAMAMLGEMEQARELIGQSIEISPNDPYVHYYDALLKTHQGNVPAAMDALETAIELGYSRRLLAAEPYLRSLMEQERFAALVLGGDEN